MSADDRDVAVSVPWEYAGPPPPPPVTEAPTGPADELLPEGWGGDAYWRSALHILGGFPGNDGRIWTHITPAGIDYAAILDEGWSGGQRRVLQAASSLWAGTSVCLLDLIAGLDDNWWKRLNEAAEILRAGLR